MISSYSIFSSLDRKLFAYIGIRGFSLNVTDVINYAHCYEI